jgi:tetraacyldisaccharide 4'-kinase
MSINIVSLFERLFFKPHLLDWILIILLTPISLIYGSVTFIRRVLTPKESYNTPIISVGNLTVGGTGKTPFTIALASKYRDVSIISRGYGRESRGLIEVSDRGKILVDVFQSGDEAMLIAKSLSNASVIVSEDRKRAIELAIKKGAKLIILDDGFNRVEIKKFEILLFPKSIRNYLPFPAGAFREFYFSKYFADLNLLEDRDFRRVVNIKNPTSKMLLVTAISNPKRLDPFLPSGVIDKIYFKDHAYFNRESLRERMRKIGANSLLVTQKDEVKMKDFDLSLSVMELKLEIKGDVLNIINGYIKK